MILMFILAVLAGIFFFLMITAVFEYCDYRNGRDIRVIKTIEGMKNISGNKGTDNRLSSFSGKDMLPFVCMAGIFIILFICFYNLIYSFVTALIFSIIVSYITISTFKDRKRKKRNEFSLQFRDWLLSLSNSLKAGMSMEESIKCSISEMEKGSLLMKKRTKIIKHLQDMIIGLNYGKPLIEVLDEFYTKVGDEDVRAFVTAVKIVREKGGNMAEVICSISGAISEKITINQEIDSLLYGKKMEGKIIVLVPLLLVVLVSASSQEYMDMMFNTAIGNIVCIISAVMITAGYILSQKIMSIRILS